MTPVRFSILGVAIPKGSTRGFAIPVKDRTGRRVINPRTGFPKMRVVITSDNPAVKHWQQEVARAAQLALGGVQLELAGAVELEATFLFAIPASYPKAFQGPHVVKPDVDKCLRAILDALTGIVYRDDSQVTRITTSKAYTTDRPRVDVTITPADAGLPLFPDLPRSAAHAGHARRARVRTGSTPTAVPW